MSAGIHGEYEDITHTDLHHIFHKVRAKIGIGKNPYNVSNDDNATEEYYAVLFNLDISGSMSGHKWDVTRQAVIDFIRYLGPNDIVSAVVFNDYPHLVMHWNTKQGQKKMGGMTGGLQPFGGVMANEGYYDPNEFNDYAAGNGFVN